MVTRRGKQEVNSTAGAGQTALPQWGSPPTETIMTVDQHYCCLRTPFSFNQHLSSADAASPASSPVRNFSRTTMSETDMVIRVIDSVLALLDEDYEIERFF